MKNKEIITHHASCQDCGCNIYQYSVSELDFDIYKLRCKDCGRLIEGERAEEIFREHGHLPELDYKQLTHVAMGLVRNAIGYQDPLYTTILNVESVFRCLPECNNTIVTIKGIIGYHQWCQDNDASGNFLCDALHDINECILNYKEDDFCPRTSSYVDYKEGGHNEA